jgi:hypothetical protein
VPIRKKARCQAKIDSVPPVRHSRKHSVDIHSEHRGSHVWKCRYCCNPSIFVCYGTVHFCERCHDRNSQRVRNQQRGSSGPPPLEAIPVPRWTILSLPPNVKGRTIISMVPLRHVNMFITALFAFHLQLELRCSWNQDRKILSLIPAVRNGFGVGSSLGHRFGPWRHQISQSMMRSQLTLLARTTGV